MLLYLVDDKEVKIHTLKINRDIDVHNPPASNNLCNINFKKSEVTFCNMRPILKLPSTSPRSCRGSQTDISALSPSLLDQSSGKI